MKTKKQIESKYLKSRGNICPFCESNDISASQPEFYDSGFITQDVTCENCGMGWTDEYQLTGMDYTESPSLDRALEKCDIPQ